MSATLFLRKPRTLIEAWTHILGLRPVGHSGEWTVFKDIGPEKRVVFVREYLHRERFVETLRDALAASRKCPIYAMGDAPRSAEVFWKTVDGYGVWVGSDIDNWDAVLDECQVIHQAAGNLSVLDPRRPMPQGLVSIRL